MLPLHPLFLSVGRLQCKSAQVSLLFSISTPPLPFFLFYSPPFFFHKCVRYYSTNVPKAGQEMDTTKTGEVSSVCGSLLSHCLQGLIPRATALSEAFGVCWHQPLTMLSASYLPPPACELSSSLAEPLCILPTAWSNILLSLPHQHHGSRAKHPMWSISYGNAPSASVSPMGLMHHENLEKPLLCRTEPRVPKFSFREHPSRRESPLPFVHTVRRIWLCPILFLCRVFLLL